PTGSVTGIDFCEAMLERAPTKAREAGLDIDFQVADVTALPFAERSFDVVAISFGIRNVEDPQKALREMVRTLKDGGVLMVLEFGQPRNALWRRTFDFYSRSLLPRLGGWITGRPQAYEYLQDSSAIFPCGEAFAAWMHEAGCRQVQ